MANEFLFKQHPNFCSVFVKVCDVLLYICTGLAAYYFKFGDLKIAANYAIAFLIAVLLLIPIFSSLKVYKSLRGRTLSNFVRPLFFAFGLQVLTLATIAFVTKTGVLFSREWFLTWNTLAITCFIGFRLGLRQILFKLRSKGFNHKSVVIIGSGDFVAELVSRVRNEPWIGFDIVATLTQAQNSLPQNLAQYIATNAIDEVWLMPSPDERNLVKTVLNELRHNVITIRYFPEVYSINTLNHSISEILGMPVINIISSPMTGSNFLVKAIEDRLLAFIILLLVSPIMLIIASIIKLTSPGPVFYRQLRHGCDGKPITIYKFRTMKLHQETTGVVTQAINNDPRVTKIGKVLRSTSLDELPQFINVLMGNMSIVGPRPHAIEHNEKYKEQIKSFMQRHQVKPGITGWAQINGWRGETDTLEKMQKRIEYDIYYINNWSLWLDLKIIFLTVLRGFVHKNAY
jgi:putative colanic acid biosysnthesis UDP-glucose lipid carrier transferase